MQSPPLPRYLFPSRSKYSPQHHVLKYSQLPFLQQCQRPSFTPYKTTSKIILLYILIFKFLDSNLEDKKFCTEWQQAFPDLNLLLISPAIEFWFVKVVPKYLNSSTLSKVLLTILKLWIHPAFWSRDMTMYLVLSALLVPYAEPYVVNTRYTSGIT